VVPAAGLRIEPGISGVERYRPRLNRSADLPCGGCLRMILPPACSPLAGVQLSGVTRARARS
jgi:hypothetical protein